MSLGVREKLFLVSLLLILVVGLAAGLYLERRLGSWIQSRIEAELQRHAQTARVLIERSGESGAGTADAIADWLGATTASRITIIDRDGRVSGDSELGDAELARVENHADRPELRQALKEGLGVNRRHSATLGTDMLYVAVPFGGPPAQGTVRAAMALADVDRAIRELRVRLLIAGMIGLVVAVLMSALASHLLTRTLRSLLQHARSVSRQATSSQPAGKDEILGLAGSFHRLSAALQQQMDQLAAERDRSQAILACMSEGLFALDRHREIGLVNRAALDLLSLEKSPIGRTLPEVTGIGALSATVEDAMSGNVVTTEFELSFPEPRFILARAAPYRGNDGCVVVMHDITEIRRMERFLRDFVANASHELRTPVSVIRATAETLLDGALANPDVAPRLVESLERNAERLVHIISDLLDLSRLDAKCHRLQPSPIDLATALNRAVETLAGAASAKRLQVTVEVEQEPRARADPKALDQVLLNLLDNAVKYTPPEGVIRVSGRALAGEVRVEVSDTGPGIPAQQRERVFERFYRVDPGRSRELGGTGLGLAIVKDLLEAMGGKVGMVPRDPHGSVFWFTVPAASGDG